MVFVKAHNQYIRCFVYHILKYLFIIFHAPNLQLLLKNNITIESLTEIFFFIFNKYLKNW